MDRIYDLPLLGTPLKVISVKRHLAWINKRLADSPERIESRRIDALRSVCLEARRRSPFYRRIWDGVGVTEAGLKTLRDPSILPVVSKAAFRTARPAELCSDLRALGRAREVLTTGSTGSPVRILLDRESVLFTIALYSPASMTAHLKLPLGRGVAIMVQSPDAIEAQALREFPRVKERFLDALAPSAVLLEEINRLKPRYILSYPGIIREIAAEARRRRLPVWQPDVLLFSGENLAADTLASIHRTFPAAVVSQAYCATESAGIAVACSRGPGLHVLNYRVIVEILDRNDRPCPPGETGRIVVTDLQNRLSPVIRYAGLGDLGSWAEGPCGCPLAGYPRLARIDGRDAETIRLPDGGEIHQFILTSALESFDRIAAFQLRQETPGAVRVLIVPEPSAGPGTASPETLEEEARRRLQPLLPGAAIAVEIVSDLPRGKGGHKTPAVVNLLRRVAGE